MAYQGGDVVLDYSPLRQDYYKNQATQANLANQRRKQQEAVTKKLSDLSSKINSNGIRDADVEPFMNKVKEWKDITIKADSTSDPLERVKLLREAENKYTEIDLYKNLSKNQKEIEKGTNTLFSTNPFRVKPEQANKFAEYVKLPVSEIQKRGIDWNVDFKLGARPEIWQNQIKSVFDEVQQEAQRAKGELVNAGYIKENGRTYKNTQWVANVLPETAVAKLQQRYESNEEAKEAANEEAQKLGLTVPQYLNRIVEQNKGSLTFRKQNSPLDLTPRSSGRNGGDGEPETASTFRQQLIQGILDGKQNSIDKLMAYLPQGSKIEPRSSIKTNISKGGYNLVRVNIPDTESLGGVKNLDISLSKGDAPNQLNNLFNVYSGETISMSKLNIKGGKPRGDEKEFNIKPKSNKPTQKGKKDIKGF